MTVEQVHIKITGYISLFTKNHLVNANVRYIYSRKTILWMSSQAEEEIRKVVVY